MVFLKNLVALLPIAPWVRGFVVPENIPNANIHPEDIKVKYGPSTASAAFSLDLPFGRSAFELLVAAEDDPCAEGNVSLNGISVKIRDTVPVIVYDKQVIVGRGEELYSSPEIKDTIRMKWQILCLLAPGASVQPIEPARLLSVKINPEEGRGDDGFTISFQQVDRPGFVQYSPHYIDIENPGFDYASWRPREAIDEVISKNPDKKSSHEASADDNAFEADPELVQSQQYQALFNSLIQHFKGKFKAVKSKAHDMIKCHSPKVKATINKTLDKVEAAFQSSSYEQSALGTFISDRPSSLSPASQVHAPAPSQTRSLAPTSSSTFATQHDQPQSTPPSTLPNLNPRINLKVISILFPLLILTSMLLWLFLRFRDPRRRAERAAEKELRRNQKLYRRAARCHKWKTSYLGSFLCKFRKSGYDSSGCGASSAGEIGRGVIGGWDEKRSRVMEQETTLDAITGDEIRRLCHQTALPTRRIPPPSSTLAAEEGYAFPDSRSVRSINSRRRRQSGESSSTLPDYVSDITQPPGYDEETGLEDAMNRDGWRYEPPRRIRMMTPDSSVVDTSTRDSVRSSRSGSLDLGSKV